MNHQRHVYFLGWRGHGLTSPISATSGEKAEITFEHPG